MNLTNQVTQVNRLEIRLIHISKMPCQQNQGNFRTPLSQRGAMSFLDFDFGWKAASERLGGCLFQFPKAQVQRSDLI